MNALYHTLSSSLLGAGCALLLLGCPKRVPVTEPAVELPSRDALHQALNTKTRHDALVGPFKLTLTRKGRTDRLEGALAIHWPVGGSLQLRIELFGPLGPPLAYGVLRPDQALLYLPYSGNVALTSATPARLLQQGGLALDLVLELLLGGTPPCQALLAPARVEGRLEAGCVTSPVQQDGAVDANVIGLTFHEQPLYLEALTLHLPDQPPAHLTLLHASPSAPTEVPPVTGFRWQRSNRDDSTSGERVSDVALELVLGVDELVRVLPADPNLFHLDIPEQVRSGDLDAWIRTALTQP